MSDDIEMVNSDEISNDIDMVKSDEISNDIDMVDIDQLANDINNLRNIQFELRETAFDRRIQTFAIINRIYMDITEFLRSAYYHFYTELQEILTNYPLVKVNACLEAEFQKVFEKDGESLREKQTIYINTKSKIIGNETDLNKFYNRNIIAFIMQQIDEVLIQGSGFTLSSIKEIIVQVNQYQPISGSSYIPLPKYLANKKAIIIVKNNDEQCFKWSVLSALYAAYVKKDPQRVAKYRPFEHTLDWSDVTFPMEIRKIKYFERRNNISINVYHFHFKDKRIYPLRLTEKVLPTHIHLLLLKNPEKSDGTDYIGEESINEEELFNESTYVNGELNEILSNSNKTHYCWIKSMSALLSSQIS